MFVVRSTYGEHGFDGSFDGDVGGNFDGDVGGNFDGDVGGNRVHEGVRSDSGPGVVHMTAIWLQPTAAGTAAAPGLRLVGGGDAAADGYVGSGWVNPLTVVPDPRRVSRRVSPEVRRRRLLFVLIGLLLLALALPLSGTGGYSHATGPALAETGHPVTYVVQPGDTLWSIAQRVEPNADPRPLVARLAAQTGSDTVVPGEHLVLP
jgi:hypothetical protein